MDKAKVKQSVDVLTEVRVGLHESGVVDAMASY